MQSLGFSDKQKRSSSPEKYTQFVALPSESKDVAAAGRGSFGFRNRYLAKRQVIRTIRRLRQERV